MFGFRVAFQHLIFCTQKGWTYRIKTNYAGVIKVIFEVVLYVLRGCQFKGHWLVVVSCVCVCAEYFLWARASSACAVAPVGQPTVFRLRL